MKRYVMRLWGSAYVGFTDHAEYLKDFDADAHDGGGSVEATADPKEAMKFSTAGAGLELWRTPSTVRPLRDDGKPNRPLSAFTIEMIEMEFDDVHH